MKTEGYIIKSGTGQLESCTCKLFVKHCAFFKAYQACVSTINVGWLGINYYQSTARWHYKVAST
jgi:hypothetical protein